MIRRLTLMCFCSDIEFLRSQITQIQDKIVEILKWGSISFVVEVLFLARILVFKLGADSPAALWPILTTEILGVLRPIVSADSSSLSVHASSSHHACRLVDLIFAVKPSIPYM